MPTIHLFELRLETASGKANTLALIQPDSLASRFSLALFVIYQGTEGLHFWRTVTEKDPLRFTMSCFGLGQCGKGIERWARLKNQALTGAEDGGATLWKNAHTRTHTHAHTTLRVRCHISKHQLLLSFLQKKRMCGQCSGVHGPAFRYPSPCSHRRTHAWANTSLLTFKYQRWKK